MEARNLTTAEDQIKFVSAIQTAVREFVAKQHGISIVHLPALGDTFGEGFYEEGPFVFDNFRVYGADDNDQVELPEVGLPYKFKLSAATSELFTYLDEVLNPQLGNALREIAQRFGQELTSFDDRAVEMQVTGLDNRLASEQDRDTNTIVFDVLFGPLGVSDTWNDTNDKLCYPN